jgi:phospholipase/carboxylesterase
MMEVGAMRTSSRAKRTDRVRIGLGVAVLIALAFGCRPTHDDPAAGVRIVEVFAQGADTSSPLVVWLHGRGGSPERFESWWRGFPVKVEVALPQGFSASGSGWAWFDWPPGTTEDDLADVVGAAEERLWRAVTATAHGRKVIVGGFSQGAVLAYAMAARHPEAVAYAFPIAGLLPPKLVPSGPAAAAPVFAMHGTADDVIAVDYGRAAIAALQKRPGGIAELREFRGVGHTLTQEMRDELAVRIRALVGSVADTPR